MGEGRDEVRSWVDYGLGGNVDNLTLTGTAVRGTGNDLANIITGNASGNSLDGGTGADTLVGGAGNDTLFGNGVSTLQGGADNDTYVVSSNADTIIDDSGTDTVLATVGMVYTLGSDIENLTYSNTDAATFVGNNGNNLIDASSATSAVSLSGNGGRDTLIGGSNDDILRGAASSSLVGGDGNDTFYASGSDISINGGNGDNVFIFDNSAHFVSSTVSGGIGNDTIQFTVAVNLDDTKFVHVNLGTGTDRIEITGSGNYIELGINAQNAGISTVTGGTGINSIIYTHLTRPTNLRMMISRGDGCPSQQQSSVTSQRHHNMH